MGAQQIGGRHFSVCCATNHELFFLCIAFSCSLLSETQDTYQTNIKMLEMSIKKDASHGYYLPKNTKRLICRASKLQSLQANSFKSACRCKLFNKHLVTMMNKEDILKNQELTK